MRASTTALEEGQPWTTNDVVSPIKDEFGVSYHLGYVSRLLRYTYGLSSELGIVLVFLSIAPPHLQPIEPVWGKLKHDLSLVSAESSDHFRALVEETYLKLTRRLSFTADWLDQFIDVNTLR